MARDFRELLQALSSVAVSFHESSSAENMEIAGIASNSSKVGKNFVFCAVEGAAFDGHSFIADAVQRGAKVIIHTHAQDLPENVSSVQVKDSRYAWALTAGWFYGNPADFMEMYAVTGTNGKTSIAFMIRRLLSRGGKGRCGLLSTVEYDCGGGSILEGVRTTPDAAELQQYFLQMKVNHCRCAVMEASSHGLHQHRMGRTLFSGAVFTNLTGDHLDYHKTMEAYYQAKKLLFTEQMKPGGICVINIDDLWGKRLAGELAGRELDVITLSAKEKDAAAWMMPLELSASGVRFSLRFRGKETVFHSRLIGLHNIYNLSEAALCAIASGVPEESAVETLAAPDIAPPGRLEPFDLPSGAAVFVDYAHTDDALTRVLEALKALSPRRIITVFGCGGDRDRTKRPRMAAAVSPLSGQVIVTSDNPRTEDPSAIIRDILPGFPEGASYTVEPDRAKAIRLALSSAEKGDMVLIAGKGHENYQEINGVRHHFDDREQVRSFIQEKIHG